MVTEKRNGSGNRVSESSLRPLSREDEMRLVKGEAVSAPREAGLQSEWRGVEIGMSRFGCPCINP